MRIVSMKVFCDRSVSLSLIFEHLGCCLQLLSTVGAWSGLCSPLEKLGECWKTFLKIYPMSRFRVISREVNSITKKSDFNKKSQVFQEWKSRPFPSVRKKTLKSQVLTFSKHQHHDNTNKTTTFSASNDHSPVQSIFKYIFSVLFILSNSFFSINQYRENCDNHPLQLFGC